MCSAIIVAAGSSRRMGFNKLLAPLAGIPVIRRTVEAFARCTAIQEIIVVGSEDLREVLAGIPKLKALIPGGTERHHSVWAGLQQLDPSAEIIAIHDGGRPLITAQQIEKCISAAQLHSAAASARPITETLKRCDAEGRILSSIDRTHAWIMETPQVFQRHVIISAYQQVLQQNILVTDEVSAAQLLGITVYTVQNDTPNLKITYPADLQLAERLL
jgi:2-C-methyl-D-erythritol 4-phosphate cytidylyltransferase